VNVKTGETKCTVLGDSIIRNVGVDKSDMGVECFPGIRTEQLRTVMENKMLGCPDTMIMHVGTNDVRRSRNLD
jgi:hypothetical protein